MSLFSTPLLRLATRHQLKKQVFSKHAQIRWLNLQEYQSKKLMADNGICVQRFGVASQPEEAIKIAKDLNADEFVIKAQILAGGRGKGIFDHGFQGGVHLTRDLKEVGDLTNNMIGHTLRTKQTSGAGVKVRNVMVAHSLEIVRETYLAILMDREYNGPVIVASPMGGVDIEDVAAKQPEAIFKEPIDIMTGITDEQALSLARNLQFKGDKLKKAADEITKLYEFFLKVDATQVEINPFGETSDNQVVCFDAKINFDDNSSFRQKDIFALDDPSESDWREVEANKHNLNYIGMDGNIGCLVNGAGLAMATMDIIKHFGGEPANFLDVGGSVKEDQIYSAFKLLNADTQVKAILVNIFAGIVNCEIVARGISNACRDIDMSIPIIVRLEGNNVEKARKLFRESDLPIVMANGLADAAEKSVKSLYRKSTQAS